jgi:hypothetical protein
MPMKGSRPGSQREIGANSGISPGPDAICQYNSQRAEVEKNGAIDSAKNIQDGVPMLLDLSLDQRSGLGANILAWS